MKATTTSAVEKFVRASAEEYLQTVVLVDDRIFETAARVAPKKVTKPPSAGRKAAVKNPETAVANDKSNEPGNPPQEALDEASFQEVQNSFAKKRIICSLHQPRATASFGAQSEVYKLCSASDVVIVDWDLHSDNGVNATKLVGGLIEESQCEIPQQLRLVLIYTLEPNLQSIANRAFEDLEERLGAGSVTVDKQSGGLALSTEHCRVVVLGKRANENLTQFADHYVPEKNLADRTVLEFSRLAPGLLQGIALRGMANLRRNNRRALARFGGDLDLAFLIHRALVLPEEEPLELVSQLLSDEIRAILEDTLGSSPLGTAAETREIVSAACVDWAEMDDPEVSVGEGVDPGAFAIDALSNGAALEGDYGGKKKGKIQSFLDSQDDGSPVWKRGKCRALARYLLGKRGDVESHERFSSLMSQRTLYRDPRRLHLGAWIRELAGEERYFLCLQPLCDSVRLHGPTQFLFCVAAEASAEKTFTHCVTDPRGEVLRLKCKPSIAGLHIFSFRTSVVSKQGDGRFIISDESGSRFEWIAQLKPDHAQRVAELFGNHVSRIGLSQSEWQRVIAQRD